jgi:hypothetical protein
LKGYGLEACKPSHIPMEPNRPIGLDPHRKSSKQIEDHLLQVNTELEASTLQTKLQQCDNSTELLNQEEKQRYMLMVGSLQHVATVTRPDICFAASS